MMGLAIAGFAGGASAATNCDITIGVDGDGAPTDIAADTVWAGTVCVKEPVFVQPDVTLTIDPGTIVRGEPRTAAPGAVNDSPGALIVTQGGKIRSVGTVNDPIIMTTGAVDNDQDGVCDDGDGDGWFDPAPGFVDNGGCIAAGTCTSPADDNTNANATWCDADPQNNPMPPLAADGSANLSEWGGVVILGRAPTNLAHQFATPGDVARTPALGGSPSGATEGEGYGYGFIEGLQLPGFDELDAQCGGVEPHDSSGIMQFTSVRHAGDEIGNGNELNGISLCGVGDSTILEFIEIVDNFDDGIEFFGGTANLDHVVISYVGDDQLDFDWGYTGAIQFAFITMPFFNQQDGTAYGSGSGDKMHEMDGDDYNADDAPLKSNVNVRVSYNATVFPGETNIAFAADERDPMPWPLSQPVLSNITGIGSTPDVWPIPAGPGRAATNLGVQMRHGFAGTIQNSLYVNTGGTCLVIDGDSGESTTNHDTKDHIAQDLVRWEANSCDGSAAFGGGSLEEQAADNGDARAAFDDPQGGCEANIRSTSASFTGLVDEDPDFDGTFFAGTIDPHPIDGYDCPVTPLAPGFDRAVTYRGAFPPVGPLWTDNWTYLSKAGVL